MSWKRFPRIREMQAVARRSRRAGVVVDLEAKAQEQREIVDRYTAAMRQVADMASDPYRKLT
jgi:hypothetical protein